MGECSTKFDDAPMTTGPLNGMSPTYQPYSLLEDVDNIKIQEDDTCFMLSIEMPNVQESDVQISLRKNVLTISGFRSSRCYSDDEDDSYEGQQQRRTGRAFRKRQRLSRQLEIDPNAIDLERAMASTWNGCYTLYAPKRRSHFDQNFCF